MKKSNKVKTIIGAITLLFSNGIIRAEIPYKEIMMPGVYGVPNKSVSSINTILKVAIIPIAFIIGLCVVIFGKKFNMKKKTRMIVFTILMLIAIIITTILFMI